AVLDLFARTRTGPADGPHVLRQGCRAPRAASRGRRVASRQPASALVLGGPGRVRRARAAVAPRTALSPSRHSGHGPAVALPPRESTVDLPAPDRAAADPGCPGHLGGADGAGEPALGV